MTGEVTRQSNELIANEQLFETDVVYFCRRFQGPDGARGLAGTPGDQGQEV